MGVGVRWMVRLDGGVVGLWWAWVVVGGGGLGGGGLGGGVRLGVTIQLTSLSCGLSSCLPPQHTEPTGDRNVTEIKFFTGIEVQPILHC